ncbi:hypothetical protein GLN3_09085 [Geobacillus lituanicus]|nr:hypothetical protein GLN3_09085 [Geobacillus lituanicus]
MSTITTFDSTVESLLDLLESIQECRTQLPDFQRGWVWDDERIRNLLISVSLSYPIGAVMMLQTGNPNVRFASRPIEGVDNMNQVEPERLILDGQQRLTALFQSLKLKAPVATRDKRDKAIKRFYYIDIDKMLDPNVDREETIVSVPEDRIIRGPGGRVVLDCSDLEKECEAGMLPVNLLFDPAGLLAWQTCYFSDPARLAERSLKWQKLMMDVFPRFQQYQVPVIMLRKPTPKEAVCQVFENVNTGGVSLTVFELLTATFAAEDFKLRDDWEEKEAKLKRSGEIYNKVLADISSTDFLQAVTLLATYNRRKAGDGVAVSCKRRDILQLTLADYQRWADRVTEGFIQAAQFLHEQHVFSARDLPYGTQLIPLAAIFVELGKEAHNVRVRDRIARWYWCGVLGELYGGATETRIARDVVEVVEWIRGGAEPTTVRDAHFAADRLFTLRTRNSAAYKGLHALLMREGARDFLSGVPIDIQTYYGESIDIHHIFSRDYCEKRGIEKAKYDCIINKTPLSYKTNRMIGRDAPSVYLKKLEERKGVSATVLDDILQTHVIDVASIRADDFDQFFEKRRLALLAMIERVMGKKVE